MRKKVVARVSRELDIRYVHALRLLRAVYEDTRGLDVYPAVEDLVVMCRDKLTAERARRG